MADLPQFESAAGSLGTRQIQAIPNQRATGHALAAPSGAAEQKSVRSLANRCRAVRQWDDRSRMSREPHVRFWESAGVKLPRATQLTPIIGNDNELRTNRRP